MNLQIIYTCPKCGADTQETILASYPPKRRIRCTKCDWEDTEESEVARVPYPVVNSFNLVDSVPHYCRSCPNHPSNGGSGFCNCTLGTPVVY